MRREPYLADPDLTLWHGDALEVLRGLPDGSVNCCVTSPPYWGLRDYGTDGQLGLEPTPEAYVDTLVAVFREVRRVLTDDGTLWLNLGDSYASGTIGRNDADRLADGLAGGHGGGTTAPRMGTHLGRDLWGKPKNLVGIPWRVAFALQANGWYLRSDIIWSKPNPMPESVTDRPTKSHEYVFLLSKSPRYFFDADAVREPSQDPLDDLRRIRGDMGAYARKHTQGGTSAFKTRNFEEVAERIASGRNIRSVWEIATQPYAEAHFATYPEELVRRCLLAGCPAEVCGTCGKARERIVETERVVRSTGGASPAHTGVKGYSASSAMVTNALPQNTTLGWSDCGHNNWKPGTVLDPFAGSGTTALVARKHGRRSVLIELSVDYCALAARRLQQLSLLAEAAP